jgi:hypothetical protein
MQNQTMTADMIPVSPEQVQAFDHKRVFATPAALSDSKTPIQKRCNKCHELKSLDEYHINRGNSDGRATDCKACRKEYMKVYNAKTKTLRNAKRRKTKAASAASPSTTTRMPAKDLAKWTAVSIRRGVKDRVLKLANSMGVPCSDVIGVALDVLEQNPATTEKLKVRARIAELQAELASLTSEAEPVTAATVMVKVTKPLAKARQERAVKERHKICTVYNCDRPARGGFKMCLHHRRKARASWKASERKRKLRMTRALHVADTLSA